MLTKKHSELLVGDVFLEPESEEEFHGEVPPPRERERYRIEEVVNQQRFSTEIRATRLSDGEEIPIVISAWVPVEVVETAARQAGS